MPKLMKATTATTLAGKKTRDQRRGPNNRRRMDQHQHRNRAAARTARELEGAREVTSSRITHTANPGPHGKVISISRMDAKVNQLAADRRAGKTPRPSLWARLWRTS